MKEHYLLVGHELRSSIPPERCPRQCQGKPSIPVERLDSKGLILSSPFLKASHRRTVMRINKSQYPTARLSTSRG
jgi:hypothetical protein